MDMLRHVFKKTQFVLISQLTNPQEKIVLAVLEHQVYTKKGEQKGIASYVVRKYGSVSASTFNDNIKELVKGKVLFITRTKKAKSQIRTFYGITHFGYFLLLKKNHKKVFFPKYLQRFLPFVFDHFNKLEHFPNLREISIRTTLIQTIPFPNELNDKFRVFIPTKESSNHISITLHLQNRNPVESLFGWDILAMVEILFFINLFFAFNLSKKSSRLLELVEQSGFSKETKKYIHFVEIMIKEYKKLQTAMMTIFKNDSILRKKINETIKISNEIVKKSLLDLPF